MRSGIEFFIIGAQRSGTTSLRAYVCAHKSVGTPLRETDWFSFNYDRDWTWYTSRFPRAKILGEKCVSYLACPETPGRIKRHIPHARFITLLRNPVDRVWSHYRWARAMHWENRPFDEAVHLGPVRSGKWFSYLKRGHYAEQLQNWFCHFGRDKFLILCSEDFFADTSRTLRLVSDFLDLDYQPPHRFTQFGTVGRSTPVPPRMRQWLAEYYKPHNDNLEQLLGRRFDW